MVDVEVRYQGAVVPDPSIVLLRVDNAGGIDIDPQDIHEKVLFAFPDRKIVGLEVTNWKQFGGKELPVRMVSRVGPDSGSRRVFRDKVLAGDQELGISSDDCRTMDDPVAKDYRCEVGTTEEVLSRVNDIEGAIGYAELGGSLKYAGINVASIDGVVAESSKVAEGLYKFWEVEHAYTYRSPKPDSLQAAFLDYLSSSKSEPILSRDGLIPCSKVPSEFCG